MLTLSRRAGRRHQGANRTGFGLVELIVAIMILSIGVLGLASTAAYVTRQVNEGGQTTFAAARVQSLIDSLRGLSTCDNLVAGSIASSADNKRIQQSWTVVPSASGRSARFQINIRWTTPRGLSPLQQFTTTRPC